MTLGFPAPYLILARVAAVAHLWLPPVTGSVRAAERSAETWQTGYTGTDAAGPQVLGYWKFEPTQATADSSGHGATLTLAGAVVATEGVRDGALESFPGFPVEDKRHAAFTASKPALSPKGAFTLEMWIKPKPELEARLSPILIDKKYAGDADYLWRLTAADKGDTRRMQVVLGFGDSSETYHSEPFVPGAEWQHIAFTYDGDGTVRFYRNGAPLGGGQRPGRGAITPGKHVFSIGDRVGSLYAGFPGFIDEVRLCEGVREFRPVAIEFALERKTWRRMEQAPPASVVVQNLSKSPLQGVKVRVSIDGREPRNFDVPTLAAGATHAVAYPLPTTLRPDTYRLQAHLEMPGPPVFVSDESTDFTIVARPLPRMPVVMWGLGSPDSIHAEMPRLKDLGFTLCLGRGADYDAVWNAGKPTAPEKPKQVAEMKEALDFALANQFGIALALSPGGWLKTRPELQRIDREGKPYATRPDVNAALPGLAEFCFNTGASMAQTYGAFPAWQAALIDSETRDSTQVSFSEFDRQAYRAFAGAEIPLEVKDKSGVDWAKLKDFPADRVIPDDHPLLKFYRWFWSVGDGWNALHSATHRGLHSTGRDDVWTWFDPAVRAPSLGGSGGAVDVLSQWTYTNPDPLRIGYFADELFAMAASSPQHPRVMKMTQLFWYRSQTAPQKAGPGHIANPFDDHDPDAAYITISPMHLRESFWTKLARPVTGLMYHGWGSLVPTQSVGGYRYTNPETKEEFRRLHRGVLEPLGPALLKMGDPASDVAFLDSFTAQMFARRGSYGYSGDDAYRTLLHAQLQPEVIYEEQLLARGLDRCKLLVLAGCDVLPASVVQRIQEFQQRGGLVIGDGDLAPAIRPDLLLPKVTRTKQAAEDKAALLAATAEFRRALDARYARAVDCTNPEIITRRRTAGDGDCVFVVNDHREFGTYVGQHGLVMENGLPSRGEITLNRPTGHVYDLVAGREIPAELRENKLHWTAGLAPGDGRAYLVAPQPIAQVKITAPETAALDAQVPVAVEIADPAGQPVPAVIPVQLEITDPAGRPAEFSGYHAAEAGRLDLRLQIAPNDAPGLWQIHARELASGQEASVYLRVTPPPAK
ncbi:MAG TPA: LamG-like jellyroll fold domain-containing protein [Chthoniobacteraceae bacterium]|jgi:hypothetical protein|nr:LamG-like jellyroll fold domain-containing protein [Chthoniobacteraceae bacterium]